MTDDSRLSPFRSDLLAGKAALVTGGGTGIGRSIALAMARHGANVAVLGRREGPLLEVVGEVERMGRVGAALPCDVRDPERTAAAVDEGAGKLGGLDILVNGAAGNFLCLAERMSPNAFGTVIDIDLKGTFHATTAAVRFLREKRGTVLNISATLQYGGIPGQLHAAAAKAGIDSVTRTLAVEWGGYGIRVNGIAPGPVGATEGAKRLLPGAIADSIARRAPLGRMAELGEISDAALFLVSDAARFVTGVTLVVDGGLLIATARFD